MQLLEIELTTLILSGNHCPAWGGKICRKCWWRLQTALITLTCVCFWCSVSAEQKEQGLTYARERGKHECVGQQHGVRQQWGSKHQNSFSCERQRGPRPCTVVGKRGLLRACVPQGVEEMLQTAALFAVSISVEKLSWMSAGLNWHIYE